MSLIRKIFPPKRCKFCYRDRAAAVHEQIERLLTCSTPNCPFQEQIEHAIHAVQKAELIAFNLSKSVALEDTYITVSWVTKNCKTVTINNYGEVEFSGQKRIQIKRDTTEIEIILEDIFGETFSANIPIKVFPKATFEILEVTDNILEGESFILRFTATNYKNIYLKDQRGNVIVDLTKNNSYISKTTYSDLNLKIQVDGKYGGQIQETIQIKTHGLPSINFFNCDNTEKVDTLPIYFEFDIRNVKKAELLSNNSFIADITSLNSFTHISQNKSNNVLILKYEIVLTGLTGKVIKSELACNISVYPQPSIINFQVSPDSIILFPKEISVLNHSDFCEYIIFSDGISEQIIKPNSSITLHPNKNTTYLFKPIGKQNFHGESKSLFVEVFYPIELYATQNKRITLPNVPVNISWQVKNQTQVIIEPGNIDVTHKTSYNIKLENKTKVKVIAINKRDRKEIPLFIDVLQYQRIRHETLRSLPRLDLNMPKIESVVPKIKKEWITGNKTTHKILTASISTRIIDSINNIIPKTDFGFQRMWRNRMFEQLKSKNKNKNEA